MSETEMSSNETVLDVLNDTLLNESSCLNHDSSQTKLGRLDPPFMTYYYGIFFFLTTVNVIGNSIVLRTFYLHRDMRTPSNSFICSLAASDLMVGLIYPFYNVSHIETEAIKRTLGQYRLCVFLITEATSLQSCSSWGLVAITVARLLIIINPLRYRVYLTKRKCVAVAVTLWILCHTACYSVYMSQPRPKEYCNICRYELIYPAQIMTFLTMFQFVIPLLIMVTANVWMAYTARMLSRRVVKSFTNNIGAPVRGVSSLWRGQKSFAVVTLLVGCFTISWIPMIIFCFVVIVGRVKVSEHEYFSATARISLYFNYAINVFIYAGRMADFREHVRRDLSFLFCFKSPRVTPVNGSTGRIPPPPLCGRVAPPGSLATVQQHGYGLSYMGAGGVRHLDGNNFRSYSDGYGHSHLNHDENGHLDSDGLRQNLDLAGDSENYSLDHDGSRRDLDKDDHVLGEGATVQRGSVKQNSISQKDGTVYVMRDGMTYVDGVALENFDAELAASVRMHELAKTKRSHPPCLRQLSSTVSSTLHSTETSGGRLTAPSTHLSGGHSGVGWVKRFISMDDSHYKRISEERLTSHREDSVSKHIAPLRNGKTHSSLQPRFSPHRINCEEKLRNLRTWGSSEQHDSNEQETSRRQPNLQRWFSSQEQHTLRTIPSSQELNSMQKTNTSEIQNASRKIQSLSGQNNFFRMYSLQEQLEFSDLETVRSRQKKNGFDKRSAAPERLCAQPRPIVRRCLSAQPSESAQRVLDSNKWSYSPVSAMRQRSAKAQHSPERWHSSREQQNATHMQKVLNSQEQGHQSAQRALNLQEQQNMQSPQQQRMFHSQERQGVRPIENHSQEQPSMQRVLSREKQQNVQQTRSGLQPFAQEQSSGRPSHSLRRWLSSQEQPSFQNPQRTLLRWLSSQEKSEYV